MEFRFRAGDRGPSSSASGGSPPAGHSSPGDGHFGAPGFQGPLRPPSAEWEAARREEIIRKEVKRRLIEEEVRREFEARGDLAFAQAHHAGFGPGHFMHAGFGERMPFLCQEERWSPPRPKLQLLEIGPSRGPDAYARKSSSLDSSDKTLSSKTKVPRMKRKADTVVGPTVPKKEQKITKDWSCALCQVSATCEAGLNEHLEGRKHKAKLAQCGASKVLSDVKNNSRKVVTGNKSVTDPCDAPKKICILVDGAMHEVLQKNKYLWCDRCKVRCDSNVTMAGHLRSKKHSKLNKVWTSIDAVRMNAEGSTSRCESNVNTNNSIEIPVVMKGKVDMAMQVDECGPVENPVEIKKESSSMASEVESTNTDTELLENSPVETPAETLKENTDMTNDVSQFLPKEE